MGMLSELREMFGQGERIDSTLYLSARMHDAEEDAKKWMKRLVATEDAAIEIIRRYDSNGDLVREFKRLADMSMRHMD